jgi:hypothetical protein
MTESIIVIFPWAVQGVEGEGGKVERKSNQVKK